MAKGYTKYIILFLIAFVVVCVYFISIESRAIYGDDMALYYAHFKNNTVLGALNFYAPLGKFRPVSGIINTLNIFLFDKNLHNYFLFNIGIQALIVCIFTLIADLVLQSFVLSSVLGFLVGLSRFAFYNITQALNGGSCEGLCMLFFLAFLYFILKFFIGQETTAPKQYKYLLHALLYANLALYTHERYVVLFVFILLATFLYRSQGELGMKKKLAVGAMGVFSILIHFALKTGVAGIGYLPGQSNGLNGFSLDGAGNSLGDGLLSIIQLNSGDPRRIGADFGSVAMGHQFLLFVTVNLIAAAVILYAIQARSSLEAGDTRKKKKLQVVLWLMALLVISLLPVVSVARLEQRWLQAPFAVFILVFAMLYTNIVSQHRVAMRTFFLLLVIHFFISDYNYLSHMDGFLYMKRSEWISSVFRDAAKDESIRSNTTNLYVLEGHRNKFDEAELSWVLADGKVFSFYQTKPKKIYYIDNEKFSDKEQLAGLLNLNPQTDQVITFDGNIHDMTNQVIEERTNWIKDQNK